MHLRFRNSATLIWAPPLLLLLICLVFPTTQSARTYRDEVADFYKTECSKCHGDRAEQRFNEKRPEPDMINTILKGKLNDNPPDMPSFEEKGVTAERAKALAAFMKQLKKRNVR